LVGVLMEPVLLQKQKLDDNCIPFIPNEAPTVERGHSFDAQGGARDDIIPRAERLDPVIPELRRLASQSQASGGPKAPSRVKRALRAARRFCLAILIGVGITLVWQSYGEQAKALIASRVPALAVLFPGTKAVAEKKVGVAAEDAVPPQASAKTELASSLSAAALNTVIQNLTEMQKTLEQLAAKQEATTKSIAVLQQAESEIGHRLSTQATVPLPPKKKPPAVAAAPVSQGQPSLSAAGAPAPRAPLSLTR
jgi:hypothetical protein